MLGVIGGSGIYEIDQMKNQEWKTIKSAFGNPSDQLLFGKIYEIPVVFLPRHGRGHVFTPSSVNYRANIDIMKKVGVTEILALSAVGSLNPDFSPGTFVLPDQFVDRTFAREKSFFGTGFVAHVSMADPVCNRLKSDLKKVAESINMYLADKATYLVMEGPQFSTKAESALYRSWGCDLIGMTNMPEAKLAREAEICYASVSMVTDYDSWHPEHDEVTVEKIIETLSANSQKAKNLVLSFAENRSEFKKKEGSKISCPCQLALENAIITDPKLWDKNKLESCANVASRILREKFK